MPSFFQFCEDFGRIRDQGIKPDNALVRYSCFILKFFLRVEVGEQVKLELHIMNKI